MKNQKKKKYDVGCYEVTDRNFYRRKRILPLKETPYMNFHLKGPVSNMFIR